MPAVALEATEQQARRAVRRFQLTAAPLRNACAFLAFRFITNSPRLKNFSASITLPAADLIK